MSPQARKGAERGGTLGLNRTGLGYILGLMWLEGEILGVEGAKIN